MDAKDYIYAAGILVTLGLGVWNLVHINRSARKTSFINTVTAQRVKWLEQIRQDISKFVGLTHHWSRSALEGTEREEAVLRDIDQLRYVIRLRLNPDDTPDRKILQLVKRIPELTNDTRRAELYEALDALTDATQEMLKAEWEKVKAEAKDGDLKR